MIVFSQSKFVLYNFSHRDFQRPLILLNPLILLKSLLHTFPATDLDLFYLTIDNSINLLKIKLHFYLGKIVSYMFYT